jgi:hypothetical protein
MLAAPSSTEGSTSAIDLIGSGKRRFTNMGGTGSGRWTYHDKKQTVEECWAIDISDVARAVDASKPEPTSSGYLRPIKPAKGR